MSEVFALLFAAGEQEFREGLDALRPATAGQTPHNAFLSTVSGLLAEEGIDRDTLCSLLAFASLALIDAETERDYLREEIQSEESECRRYRIAWQQARQRAADHLAALVESDTERDHLAVQLRERDEDVRDLANRLAEFCGITS